MAAAMASVGARVLMVSVAGGAGYASVKAGIWSDGSNSKETLGTIKERVADLRGEIYYPKVGDKTEAVTKGAAKHHMASVDETVHVGRVVRLLASEWNTAVRGVAGYLTTPPPSSSNHASYGITDYVQSQFTKFKTWVNK